MRLLILGIFFWTFSNAHASERLVVSANGRHLQFADGRPFFYRGDTAWELLHRLDLEEARAYLQNRSEKGFTVIQTVPMAELDGLNTPNALGHRPFIDNNPARPDLKPGKNGDYWDHVDAIIRIADEYGLTVGLLPTWGDKWQSTKGGLLESISGGLRSYLWEQLYLADVGARQKARAWRSSPLVSGAGPSRGLSNGFYKKTLRIPSLASAAT